MQQVADIVGVAITLDVHSNSVLFVLLGSDGSINRKGDGSPKNSDRNLFIGRTLVPLLRNLLTHLTDDMLRHMVGYDIPDKVGDPCKLSIALHFSDGSNNGFSFTYGSQSQGPPTDIVNFVRAAVTLTDAWWQSQKALVANAPAATQRKRWWRIW